MTFIFKEIFDSTKQQHNAAMLQDTRSDWPAISTRSRSGLPSRRLHANRKRLRASPVHTHGQKTLTSHSGLMGRGILVGHHGISGWSRIGQTVALARRAVRIRQRYLQERVFQIFPAASMILALDERAAVLLKHNHISFYDIYHFRRYFGDICYLALSLGGSCPSL